MGRVGGLVACVLGFALVLGVAFGCRGLSVLLLVIIIDRHDKSLT
jgi:hypothetical protein